jgi:tryptophanyl-tRNA synthetase
MADRLARGGYGYGDAKKALLAAIDERFGEARARRADLAARPGDVAEILAEGARRARVVAREVVGAAREAVGMTARPS